MSLSFQKVSEFHFILPAVQIPQALQEGLAGGIQLQAEDSPEAKVRSYVGLFFNGNNPVLRQKLRENEDLCVLKISATALNVPEAVIADRDVTDADVSFYLAGNGLKQLDFSVLRQKEGWTDRKCSVAENQLRGKLRTATLLVPEGVPGEAILGIYVASEKVRAKVLGLFRGQALRPLIVNPPLFFERAPVFSQSAAQGSWQADAGEFAEPRAILPPEQDWDYGDPEEEDLGFGGYVASDDEEEVDRGEKTERGIRFQSDLELAQRKTKRQKLRSSSSSSEEQ